MDEIGSVDAGAKVGLAGVLYIEVEVVWKWERRVVRKKGCGMVVEWVSLCLCCCGWKGVWCDKGKEE